MQLIATERMNRAVLKSFFDKRADVSALPTSARAMSQHMVKPDPLDPVSKVNVYAKPKDRYPVERKKAAEAAHSPYDADAIAEARAAIFA
jgi:hypothetical protein